MNKAFAVLLFSTNAIAANNATDEPPVVELDEMVVSASKTTTEVELAKPVAVLSAEELRRKIGGNIGDTLKNEPGITSQSFGPGVGSPVIRGQSGARVRVMQNSMGNNDVSSLSPDHANSVEPILAERIEVLRGAATLLYGSGNIGGAVNVIDNRIPETLPISLIGGAAEQRYDSSTNETASVVKIEGGKQGWAYHLDGFYRNHGKLRIGGQAIDEQRARATDPTLADVTELDNPNGFVKDTRGWSRGGAAGLSYIADKGLIGASINRLENNYGIPADGTGSDPVRIFLQQDKYNLKAQLTKPFAFVESLRYKFGYTDYKHTELDNGIPATTFLNESVENRLELQHQAIAGIKGMFGFQSTNSQFSVLGDEAIVPNANISSYALFLLETLETGNLSYQLGGRAELQRIKPKNGDSFSYTPLSGSASVNWKINPQHQLSFTATHSERAPLLQELLSNGVHAATRSYEVGSADLGKEFSNNIELGYHFQSEWANGEVNLFHNWVNDYIYQQRSGQVFNTALETMENGCSTGSADCLPVEQSQQRNATFKGFEAKLNVPLMKNAYGKLDLSLFGDYTRGRFVGGGNVPRMPPLRYGFELDYEYKDLSTNIRLTRAEAQNYVAQNDSNTPGYLLLNLGAQYKIGNFYDSKVLLFANGKNLLNENIRNSTSYLRNFAPDAGRSAEVGIRLELPKI
jgi:iron complex outermembrane receptor protein